MKKNKGNKHKMMERKMYWHLRKLRLSFVHDPVEVVGKLYDSSNF